MNKARIGWLFIHMALPFLLTGCAELGGPTGGGISTVNPGEPAKPCHLANSAWANPSCGNAEGYGGSDEAYIALEQTKLESDQTLFFIHQGYRESLGRCPAGWAKEQCGVLPTLSEIQVRDVVDALVASATNYMELLRGASAVKVVFADNVKNGGDAYTENRVVTIHRSRWLGFTLQKRIQLMLHELGHVLFGAQLLDEAPYKSFPRGAFFLDALGDAVASYLYSKGLVRQVLLLSPLGYYGLNELSPAVPAEDLSQFRNPGLYGSNVELGQAGVVGTAPLGHSGTGGAGISFDIPQIVTASGSWVTLVAWVFVKPNADRYSTLVTFENGYRLVIDSEGPVRLGVTSGDIASEGAFTQPGVVTKERWYHVAAIFYNGAAGEVAATRCQVFVNGVLQPLGEYKGPTGGKVNSLFKIAGRGAFGRYAGLVDELALFNRALTPGEIFRLFSAATPPEP